MRDMYRFKPLILPFDHIPLMIFTYILCVFSPVWFIFMFMSVFPGSLSLYSGVMIQAMELMRFFYMFDTSLAQMH